MHLDLSGLWRRRQARAILAHLRRARGRTLHRADGRPQRMERQWRLPARLRRRSRFRALRSKLPRPPPDRLARPDHGQPRPEGDRQRCPPHRRLPPRLRSSADLGGPGPAGANALAPRPPASFARFPPRRTFPRGAGASSRSVRSAPRSLRRVEDAASRGTAGGRPCPSPHIRCRWAARSRCSRARRRRHCSAGSNRIIER